ncbi:MAG: hypothetical protein JW971_00445 [Synergistales bacterium]|nr:hypothetical protein [Synergistales bacterium]
MSVFCSLASRDFLRGGSWSRVSGSTKGLAGFGAIPVAEVPSHGPGEKYPMGIP